MKKLISLFLMICLLGNGNVFAAEDESAAFMSLVNESRKHLRIGLFVTDVTEDKANHRITFKSIEGEDTSTYVIDEETLIYTSSLDDENTPTLEWFLDGRATGIDIVIKEADYYRFTKKQNETIHVSGVGGFFDTLVGVGGGDGKDAQDYFYDFFWIFDIMQPDALANGFDRVDITRGEMAQVLINLLHLRGAEASILKDEEFDDVQQGHWAYNAVHLCKQAGLVNGYPDGTFGVDEQITYEQAVKMLVSVLGYAPLAAEKGGYPTGYLQVAQDIGITEGVSFVATDFATRETIAQMIMNLVYLPIMEQTGYGREPRYEIMDGTNGNEVLNFYEKYFR